jgi:hypothetical protein
LGSDGPKKVAGKLLVPFGIDIRSDTFEHLQSILSRYAERPAELQEPFSSLEEQETFLIACLNLLQAQLYHASATNSCFAELNLNEKLPYFRGLLLGLINTPSLALQDAVKEVIRSAWTSLLPTSAERRTMLWSMLQPQEDARDNPGRLGKSFDYSLELSNLFWKALSGEVPTREDVQQCNIDLPLALEALKSVSEAGFAQLFSPEVAVDAFGARGSLTFGGRLAWIAGVVRIWSGWAESGPIAALRAGLGQMAGVPFLHSLMTWQELQESLVNTTTGNWNFCWQPMWVGFDQDGAPSGLEVRNWQQTLEDTVRGLTKWQQQRLSQKLWGGLTFLPDDGVLRVQLDLTLPEDAPIRVVDSSGS